jgi:Mlc titration factor MtfA (ptsG expression regulator)
VLLNVLVLGVVVVALGGAFFGLRPLLLRWVTASAARHAAQPIPLEWLPAMERRIPAIRHLTPAQQHALLRSARELITTRHWEGCNGLALTADMQLVIATQACLLTAAIPGEPYPHLREILVYPTAFVARRVCDPRAWLGSNDPAKASPELGESWTSGVIVLAWDSALQGAADPRDGRNVVFHEFAHQLASEHFLLPPGLSPGELHNIAYRLTPSMTPTVPDPQRWRRVLEESYEQLCAKVSANAASVLDPYGATNLAEFFAVATEVFFERPHELAAEDPDLYEQLRTFYRQDPAASAPLTPFHAAG